MFSITARYGDAITHSRGFRRLAGKTQVVHAPLHDHVGTRLTHTLEVAALARRVARGVAHVLPLDHDLVEAIALAHDVGHPPFGHAGEAVLARLAGDAGLGGFHHASFGVRLLTRLEPLVQPPLEPMGGAGGEQPAGDGATDPKLAALLDGVLAHSKGKAGAIFGCAPSIRSSRRRGVEALVVRAADVYAYASGDLDDARRLGVFSAGDLPAAARRIFGDNGAQVRDVLVMRTIAAVHDAPARGIHLDDESGGALAALRSFLYERFYEGEATAAQTRFARDILTKLWRQLVSAPERGLAALGWTRREGGVEAPATLRDVLDAVACMTDRFAIAACG